MDKKKVAFICVHNSCRSQIAEALGKHFAADKYDFYSAGTETKPQINQDAVRLMKQLYDIDMEQTQYSKTIDHIPTPDIAISMGCDVGCPYITQYDFWRELYYFSRYAGVSNAFALHTATQVNAGLAGIGDITGTVAPGMKAELIVTQDNPLDNLCALRNVDCVMAGGNIIDKPEFKRNANVDRELDKMI